MKSSCRSLMAMSFASSMLILPALLSAASLAVPAVAPSNSVAVFSVNDSKSMWTNIAASPLKSSIDALSAELEKAGGEEMQKGLAKFSAVTGYSLKPTEFMTKTISGLDVHVLPAAANGGKPEIVVALKFNSADDAAKLAEAMKQSTREDAEASGMDATKAIVDVTVDGQGFKAFEMFRGEASTAPDGTTTTAPASAGFFGMKGDAFVFATSRDAINAASTATTGPAFLQSEPFKKTMANLSDTPTQMWAYGDGDALSEVLANLGDPQMASAVGGMKGKTLGMTGEAAPEFMRIRMFSPAEQFTASTKIAAELSGKGAPDALRFVPAGSLLSYAVANFGGKPMYDAVMAQMAQDPNQQMMAMMAQMTMMQYGQQMGINLDRDLLGNMDKDIAMSLTRVELDPSMAAPPTVDAVIAIRMKDGAKALEVMKKIEAFVTRMVSEQFAASGQTLPADFSPFKTETIAGAEARVFGHELLQEMPVSPTYTVTKDNYLVITAQKSGMAAALSGGASIAQSPRLGKLSQMLGGNHPEVTAIDTKAIAALAKNLLAGPFGMTMEPEQKGAANAVVGLLDAMGGIYYTNGYSPAGQHTQITMMY